jgi:hypothetical protein
MGTGIIHWAGIGGNAQSMASLSATIRLIISSTFLALFMAGILDELALFISLYDALYAMIYFLWLRK